MIYFALSGNPVPANETTVLSEYVLQWTLFIDPAVINVGYKTVTCNQPPTANSLTDILDASSVKVECKCI